MRRFLSIFLAIGLTMGLMANPVDKDAARQKAEAFFTKQNPSSARRVRAQQDLKLALTSESYHVFNLGTEDGFVIISGDDCTDDILGYADSGTFDAEDMPENLRAWLQGYAEQIAWMKANGITREASPQKAPRASIAPLLTSKWDQGDPYNRQTPTDNGIHCVTGCVATAMAQVMYYWYKKEGYEARLVNDIPTYPSKGKYVEGLTAPATFDWAHMTDEYDSNSTDAEKDAVAKLMKYVGYSVQMDYGSSSSAHSQDIAPALTGNFGYKSARHVGTSQYSYEDLQTVIYTDLAAGRPVLYGGGSTGGGHEFVCDGYDEDDYFHFNWGWSGVSDGYYKLSLCNPLWQGIGGSSTNGAFYMVQDAVCGIHPTQTVSLPIEPMECASEDDISLQSIDIPTLYVGETTDIKLTLYNKNKTTAFNGNVILKLGDFFGNIIGGTIVNIPPQSSREYIVPVTIIDDSWSSLGVLVYDVITNASFTRIYTRTVTINPALPEPNGTVTFKANYAEIGKPLSYQLSGDVASLPASKIHPQWQINKNGEDRWENIAGATGTTYTPIFENEKKSVRVVIKADGYHGELVSDERYVLRPTLTGKVTLIHDAYPSPGTKLTFKLEGAVADIDPSWIKLQWMWSPTNGMWGWQNIEGETGPSYTLKTTDVGRYIWARITDSYYGGSLLSVPVKCVKAPNTQTPVPPTLENSAYYNQIVVTNPQEGQEYILLNTKKDITSLTESDWSGAKTSEAGYSVLRMGGTVDNVNYVYTRMKETESTLAGTNIQRAGIYFGENVYVQDFDLTINKALSASSTEPLEQENGCFYTQMDEVLRLDVTPIPANATNFSGIYYDNWIDDAHNGTFYADYACTQPLQSGQSYMTVFYKPGKAENHVHVAAQYTLGYNQLAYNAHTLHIGSRIPRWYANSISATIDVYKGERALDCPFDVSPSKASLHSNEVKLVSGDGTAPSLEFVVERSVINVDATRATKGTYFFDIYQNGNKLMGGVRVNVVTPTLEEIVLQPRRFYLDRGQELALTAELLPVGAEEEITWSNSNKSVATISDDGLVRVANDADIGATTIITATAAGLSASCELTVPGEKYPLYLAGTQVTTRNRKDLGEVLATLNPDAKKRYDDGDMKVSFDGKTLRMKNAIIDATGGSANGITLGKQGMTVVVEGDCRVMSTYPALRMGQNATIVGDGTLTLQSGQSGILFNGADFIDREDFPIILTVEGVTLSIQSNDAGIYSNGNGMAGLVLTGTDVTINSTSNGAIYNLMGGIELNNCHITEPAGAEVRNGGIWDGDSRPNDVRIELGEILDLVDFVDNRSTIDQKDGYLAKVTLIGRTLYKNGKWNTLCLPFNLSAAQVTAQLAPDGLKTLSETTLNGTTLTLTFADATEIEAGKPYIIKWNPAAQDLVTPEFTGVTINSAMNKVETTYADFVGTYAPITFTTENRSVLFLGSDSKFYYPDGISDTSIRAFRGYFQLKDITAGSPSGIKEFVMDLEGDATPLSEELRVTSEESDWFTIDGRKLDKPQKGINIIHYSDGTSRKIVIK